MDCKQNRACGFQIINLLFTGRKWPTFGAKVAGFFVINGWLFMVKSVSCRQNDKRRNNKTLELMRKQ